MSNQYVEITTVRHGWEVYHLPPRNGEYLIAPPEGQGAPAVVVALSAADAVQTYEENRRTEFLVAVRDSLAEMSDLTVELADSNLRVYGSGYIVEVYGDFGRVNVECYGRDQQRSGARDVWTASAEERFCTPEYVALCAMGLLQLNEHGAFSRGVGR